MNYVRAQRSGHGESREIETSRRFRGEYNGCENECQGVAPESSRKVVPILILCVPQAILEDSTLAIAIINVTFYYRSVYVYWSGNRTQFAGLLQSRIFRVCGVLLIRIFLNRVMYRETARAPPLCTESAGLGTTARRLRLGARGLQLGARGLRARTRGDTP